MNLEALEQPHRRGREKMLRVVWQRRRRRPPGRRCPPRRRRLQPQNQRSAGFGVGLLIEKHRNGNPLHLTAGLLDVPYLTAGLIIGIFGAARSAGATQAETVETRDSPGPRATAATASRRDASVGGSLVRRTERRLLAPGKSPGQSSEQPGSKPGPLRSGVARIADECCSTA